VGVALYGSYPDYQRLFGHGEEAPRAAKAARHLLCAGR
jgi:hypothetical protein